MRSRDRLARALLLTTLCIVLGGSLGGCAVGYYGQAINGHLEVMGKRQDIAELLGEDAQTSPELRRTLTNVLEIRDFASRELGLPDNDSYRTYADLGRPYVVWNVVAAPAYSLSPKQWCFLFVGCVPYKGYFAEAKARRQAETLVRKGYDTVVGGVAAYSTLGRFDDPFLNTMVGYTEARTAGLIFHELAHQQLYVRGEGDFNEAFASFVEAEGVRRWLAARGDTQAFERWREREARQAQFTALVLGTRKRLISVYARTYPTDEALEAAKQAEFTRLRERYAVLKRESWAGYGGYDAWFEDLNNARLVSVATYRRLLPAFGAILAQEDGDLGRFLARAEELSELSAEERARRLDALLAVAAEAEAPLARASDTRGDADDRPSPQAEAPLALASGTRGDADDRPSPQAEAPPPGRSRR